MKNKLFLVVILFCVQSFAGSGGGSVTGGDGGHGVVCSDKQVQILDLFEARRAYASRWSALTSLRDRDQQVLCKIFREKKRQLRKFFLNEQLLKAFDSSCATELVNFLPDLPPTGDQGSLQIVLPNNCKIVQLALHTRKYFPEIYVNSAFVGMLSDEDLAALIFHERLHDVLVSLPSTIALRQVVGFVFADKEFQKRNIDQFYQLIEDGKLADFK